MDRATNEAMTSLQGHVNHLTDLLERISTLRRMPGLLLTPSTLTGTQLEQGFKQVGELKEIMAGNATQDALRAAQESDHVGLVEARRENRKRRRPFTPTPESPRPLPSVPQDTFPRAPRRACMTVQDVPSYIRAHNQTDSPVRLAIWTATSHALPRNAEEMILRAGIADVMYSYIRLAVAEEGRVVIESVTAFGPHERKSPHSQSDFTVFQKLSQHMTWMIQAEPDVDLDSFSALLGAYDTLFVSQCAICHRLLSEEGHVPPVCRIWIPYRKGKEAEDGGKWEPRHRTCFTP